MSNVRVDYVKVARYLEHDRAQELGRIWYETFEGGLDTKERGRSAKVNSVRRNDDGSFLYVFEAWGEACRNVEQLDWDLWSPFLDRYDVREQVDLDRVGVDRLYQHLAKHKSGSKNVQLFDSRPRSKRSGRDTGGYGLAVGSHKSDLRTSIYVRGFSQGAVEFQVGGSQLQRRVRAINLQIEGYTGTTVTKPWHALMLACYAYGWNDLGSVSGLTQDGLLDMAKNGPTAEAEVENLLANVDALLDKLPKDGLLALHESIQLRLF